MMGVMWQYDHARELGWSEYQYWMQNILPFGWAIIVPPKQESE